METVGRHAVNWPDPSVYPQMTGGLRARKETRVRPVCLRLRTTRVRARVCVCLCVCVCRVCVCVVWATRVDIYQELPMLCSASQQAWLRSLHVLTRNLPDRHLPHNSTESQISRYIQTSLSS